VGGRQTYISVMTTKGRQREGEERRKRKKEKGEGSQRKFEVRELG